MREPNFFTTSTRLVQLNQFLNSRTSYSPIALYDDENTFTYKILATDLEIKNFSEMKSHIELLQLPELLYPDELEDTETS